MMVPEEISSCADSGTRAAYILLWVGKDDLYSLAAGRVDAGGHCIFAEAFSSTRGGFEVVFEISCRALYHQIGE